MDSLIFFVIIFVIIGVALVVSHLARQRRTQQMQAIAMNNGYEFYETDPGYSTMISNGEYQLMKIGHGKDMRNILSRKTEVTVGSEEIPGMEVIFDYKYTTGSGKNSSTKHQTILSFKSEKLNLPSFYLHEEGFGSKLLSKFVNISDINFEKFPKFSNKFILYGENEQDIRNFFNETVLLFFESFKDTVRVETSKDSVMIYVSGRKLQETEMKDFSDLLKRVVIMLHLRSKQLSGEDVI